MRSSSSSNMKSFWLTPDTTVSELREALPKVNTKVYASKMTSRDECTLYFSPHKGANASRVHLAITWLIGTNTSEKNWTI